MTVVVQRTSRVKGPNPGSPFNESHYEGLVDFLSWGGRAKGGWLVSGTVDFDSTSNTTQDVQDVDVPGAAVGDYCEVVLAFDYAQVNIEAYVRAAGVVELLVTNESGSTFNPGAVNFVLRVTDLT